MRFFRGTDFDPPRAGIRASTPPDLAEPPPSCDRSPSAIMAIGFSELLGDISADFLHQNGAGTFACPSIGIPRPFGERGSGGLAELPIDPSVRRAVTLKATNEIVDARCVLDRIAELDGIAVVLRVQGLAEMRNND